MFLQFRWISCESASIARNSMAGRLRARSDLAGRFLVFVNSVPLEELPVDAACLVGPSCSKLSPNDFIVVSIVLYGMFIYFLIPTYFLF